MHCWTFLVFLQIIYEYAKLGFFVFQMFFEDNIDDAKYCGHLYGLGTSYANNGGQAYSGPTLQVSSTS